MKSIRPIVSILLAAIVLIASIGVTVNQHICMGRVQSVALFVKAASCGMMEMASAMKLKGCCDEKTIVIKSDASDAIAVSALSMAPALDISEIILPLLYSVFQFSSSDAEFSFALYKPPLIDQDITLMIRTFLI